MGCELSDGGREGGGKQGGREEGGREGGRLGQDNNFGFLVDSSLIAST